MIQRRRYDVPRVPVAMPSRAWGEEYDVVQAGADVARAPFSVEGAYAVVEISGPLSQKQGWWGEDYAGIRDRVAAALASNVVSVCLKIDSPGGDYAGCLELARDLRAMAAAVGKTLTSFTDGMACSAAYAIATAASEIVTTESAQVGSIGVWAPLVDVTAQDAMLGVRFAVASSGTSKADRNPHVGITDAAFARLQAQIDDMAEQFFALVAAHRPGLDVGRIAALQGSDLLGSRGIDAGLSDRIVNSWQSFISGEGSKMNGKASKYDEAMGALNRAADGDDEDAKRAKRALKAIENGEKPDDAEPEPDEDDKEKAEDNKEKAEDDKEKAEDKPEPEPDEDDKRTSKSAAAVAIKLAADVARLSAKIADREAADVALRSATERAAFFSTRPDLSYDQRTALDGVALERVKLIVATWPRVAVKPGASASALTPRVSGGEPTGAEPVLRHTAEEAAILARFERRDTAPKTASLHAGNFTTPFLSKSEAIARLAELRKEHV